MAPQLLGELLGRLLPAQLPAELHAQMQMSSTLDWTREVQLIPDRMMASQILKKKRVTAVSQ